MKCGIEVRAESFRKNNDIDHQPGNSVCAINNIYESLASLSGLESNEHLQMDMQDSMQVRDDHDIELGIVRTDQKHSRSLPSLKNLSAHEEALSYLHVMSVSPQIVRTPSGVFSKRSRSFTEKSAFGIETSRVKSKIADRKKSHSDRIRRSVLNASMRATNTQAKPKRNSATGFSQIVKLSFLRNLGSARRKEKRSSVDRKHSTVIIVPSINIDQDFETNEPEDATTSPPKSSGSVPCSVTLSDFEVPSITPMTSDMDNVFGCLLNDSKRKSRTSIDNVMKDSKDEQIGSSSRNRSNANLSSNNSVEKAGLSQFQEFAGNVQKGKSQEIDKNKTSSSLSVDQATRFKHRTKSLENLNGSCPWEKLPASII